MNEDAEHNEATPTPPPSYVLDDDTMSLVEIALNCMITLSDAQLDDDARENLVVIADELANRFNLVSMEVEEAASNDSTEIIYKPKGGLFEDDSE